MGEFTLPELAGEFANLKVEADIAGGLIDAWQCEQISIGKEAPTTVLQRWFENGIITAAGLLGRLEGIGWDEVDAGRLLTDVILRLELKLQRKFEKQVKQQEQQAQKEKREIERNVKEAESSAKKLEAARVKLAKAREKRQKSLFVASEKYAHKAKVEHVDAFTMFRQLALDLLRSHPQLTPDERVQVLVVAAEKLPPGDTMPFPQRVAELADGMVTVQDAIS